MNDLDKAVAKALGERNSKAYSTDWAHGGPIIERERISVMRGGAYEENFWLAGKGYSTEYSHGPTPLIAAMRCFVASKVVA